MRSCQPRRMCRQHHICSSTHPLSPFSAIAWRGVPVSFRALSMKAFSLSDGDFQKLFGSVLQRRGTVVSYNAGLLFLSQYHMTKHESIDHFGWRCYIDSFFYSFPNWRAAFLDVATRNSYEKKHDGEKNEQTGGKIGTRRDGWRHEQIAHVLRNAKEMTGHPAATWCALLT